MTQQTFIIRSARIFTGLADAPWAEAVGIRNGRIAALGTEQMAMERLPGADILDLPGRLVAPGLVDAHCHFVSLGRSRLMVDLRRLPDIEACRRRIREAAARLEPGEWLLGRGWNHHRWPGGREPDARDLDDIVPDNPAMMIRACGHSEWVNSRAMAIAGITPDASDPPGGRFDRDESGRPTGLLREARKFMMAHVPLPSGEEMRAAVLATQDEALRNGLTGVHTCESLAEWRILADLEREGLLKLRVHHLLQPGDLDEAADMGLGPGAGSERLWIGHVKHFADGSLGAGTALMRDPYSDERDNYGLPYHDLPELKEMVTAAYRRGYNVAIHAIGDRAGTNALDALAHAREKIPGPRRDRIEHVQIFWPEDLARYREMGVVASVQPVFIGTDWSVAERRWGRERRCNAYGWKTLLDRGIRLQFGSDAPVEPNAPILGLQAAVLRQAPDLKPEGGWRPEERLTLEEALSGFSATAAWTAGREDRLGSLKPGNLADLTVFEKDLATIPPEEWADVNVQATVIDGEVI